MNKENFKCSFKCNQDETQIHIFQEWTPLLSRIDILHIVEMNDIWGYKLTNEFNQDIYDNW